MSESAAATVVLGLGNPLMGDDGVGIAVLERMRSAGGLPSGLRLEDGGTWGMTLLPLIEAADRLLLLDAIKLGAMPGTIHRLSWEELPRYLALKISPHQIDLKEVLALCELRGSVPDEVVALGVEPGHIGLRAELSPEVSRAVPLLLHSARSVLEEWHYSSALIPHDAHA